MPDPITPQQAADLTARPPAPYLTPRPISFETALPEPIAEGELDFKRDIEPASPAIQAALEADELQQLPSQPDNAPQPVPEATLRANSIRSDRPVPMTWREAVSERPEWAPLLEDPVAAQEFTSKAEAWTYATESRLGLRIDGTRIGGYTREASDQLKGAGLHMMLELFSPPSPQERWQVVREASMAVSKHMVLGIDTKLADQTIDSGTRSELMKRKGEITEFALRMNTGDPASAKAMERALAKAFTDLNAPDRPLLERGFFGGQSAQEVLDPEGAGNEYWQSVTPEHLYHTNEAAFGRNLRWAFRNLDGGVDGWKGVLRSAYEGKLRNLRLGRLEGGSVDEAFTAAYPEMSSELALTVANVRAQERRARFPSQIDTQDAFEAEMKKHGFQVLRQLGQAFSDPWAYAQKVAEVHGDDTALERLKLAQEEGLEAFMQTVQRGAATIRQWSSDTGKAIERRDKYLEATRVGQKDDGYFADRDWKALAFDKGAKLDAIDIDMLFNPKDELITGASLNGTPGMLETIKAGIMGPSFLAGKLLTSDRLPGGRPPETVAEVAAEFSVASQVPQRILEDYRQVEIDAWTGTVATDERIEAIDARISQKLRAWNLDKEFRDDVASSAVLRSIRDTKAIVGGLIMDPEGTVDGLAAGVALGFLGAPVASFVKGSAAQMFTNSLRSSRWRRGIAKAAIHAPEMLESARDHLTGLSRTKAMAPRLAKKVDDVVNVMETAIDLNNNQLGLPAELGAVKVRKSAMLLKRKLKALGTSNTLDLFNGLDMGEAFATWINKGTHRALISGMVERFGAKLGLENNALDNALFKSTTASAAETIAKAVDANGALPSSPVAAGLTVGGQGYAQAPLQGTLRRAVGVGGKDAKIASAFDAIQKWWFTLREKTVDIRSQTAKLRSNQEFMLYYASRKIKEHVAATEAAGGAVDTVSVARLRNQVRSDLTSVQSASGWERKLDLSDQDHLKKIVDDSEVATMVETHLDELGRNGMYEKLGRVDESFEEFSSRLDDLHRADATSSDPALVELAESKDVIALGKEVRQAYFDSPGLSQAGTHVDRMTGEVLTPFQAARRKKVQAAELRKKTKDLEGEELQAVLDEHAETVGVDRVDLKSPLDDLKRFATSDRAAANLGVRAAASGFDDGTAGLAASRVMSSVRDAQLGHMLDSKRLEALALLLSEHPEAADGWRKAIQLEAASGKPMDMAGLRRKFPEAFKDIDPTPDEHVDALLAGSREFRENVWQMRVDLGEVTPAQAAEASATYNANAYLAFDNQLVTGKSKGLRAGTGGSAPAAEGELMVQRDIKRYRLLVHQDGTPPISKRFRSREDAKAWLDAHQGSKFEEKSGVDLVGKTRLGHKYQIVSPLGEERAAMLGPLKPDVSQFLQLEKLAGDTAKLPILQALDRPGWALSTAEFDTKNAAGSINHRDWTSKPLSGKQYGPLDGKHIHRSQLDVLNTFFEATDQTEAMLKSVRDESLRIGSTNRALSLLGKTWMGASDLSKNIIIAGITRSARTMLWNSAGDLGFFAQAATDGTLLGSAAGITRVGQAGNLVWDELINNKHARKTGKLHPILEEMLQAGALDETVIGSGVTSELRALLLDFEFGKGRVSGNTLARNTGGLAKAAVLESRDTARGVARAARGKSITTPDQLLRSAEEGSENAQLVEVARRAEALREGLRRNVDPEGRTLSGKQIEAMRVTLDELDKTVKRNAPNLGASMARSWEALGHVLVQHKRGLFGEKQALMKEVYGAAANHGRMAAYLHLTRDKHFSPAQAVKQINRFMQSFSTVNPNIRKLSRRGLMNPVAGFLAESARIGTNLVAHNWPRAAAYFTTIPAANFMTLVGTGTDPYRAMAMLEAQDSSRPAGVSGTTTFMIPNGSGNISTLQFSPAHIFSFFSKPLNALAGLADTAEDDTIIDAIARAPKRFGLNMASGIPFMASLAAATGRSGENGELTRGGFSDWGFKFVGKLLSAGLPAEAPYVGSSWRRVDELEELPPAMYTNRVRTWAENRFTVAGIRLRENVNIRDVFRWSMIEAKRRLSPDEVMRFSDPLVRKLRQAIASGNTSEEMELRKQYQERWDRVRRVNSLSGEAVNSTREADDWAARMRKSTDMELSFSGQPMAVKVQTLLQVAAGLREEDTKFFHSMALRTILNVGEGSGDVSLANPTQGTQIDQAILNIERYLAAPRNQHGLEDLSLISRWLQSRRGHAKIQRVKTELMNPFLKEAVKIRKEATQ